MTRTLFIFVFAALAVACGGAEEPRSGLEQLYLAEELDRELELRARIDRACETRSCSEERRAEVMERCIQPRIECDVELLLHAEMAAGGEASASGEGDLDAPR